MRYTNKDIVVFLFFTIIISAIPSYAYGGKLRCKKLVVDTVGAMEEMRGMAETYNSIYLKNIEELKKNPGNEERIEYYKNSLFVVPDTCTTVRDSV